MRWHIAWPGIRSERMSFLFSGMIAGPPQRTSAFRPSLQKQRVPVQIAMALPAPPHLFWGQRDLGKPNAPGHQG
ncbi:hypothetical protein RUE5091_03776 [Ruegeria denitrificans]|uniref:Uncharacterized protein n=1 Tax=Ruegeria denitrificans TaxID=1715692 RepID=A0A0P1II82_9RHOB|nr:hypothetical protein RUE5091_03776 [Ruegeria denitrificans]